jgi:hypothetical protein
MGADLHVRTMVAALQDTCLQARIAGGDLIAIEAKYHLNVSINYEIATAHSKERPRYLVIQNKR